MKRHNKLFPQLVDFTHLYRAYKRALRGSGNTRESQEFSFHLESRLLALSEKLKNGSYQPSAFRYFHIFEPKKRKISVAPFRDRVVHHAVVGLLEPLFDPTFIFHSYATRKGKGTHRAIEKAQQFLCKNRWFYKADIAQFFPSIDHAILMELISRKIKDPPLLEVIDKIIHNGGENGKGLPIGNLTSQFFANVYLNLFDHFVKEELQVKEYLRYMDDFCVFHSDKDLLKDIRAEMANFLQEQLQIEINPRSSFLNQQSNGLSFLGTRIFRSTIRIKPENLHRLHKRIQLKKKAFQKGNISEETFLQSMGSFFAHLDQFNTYQLRANMLKG